MNQGHDIAAMVASVPDIVNVTTRSGKKYVAKAANEIARGGEGRILTVDGDKHVVLKLYHPGRTALDENRFNHLTKLDPAYFVKPNELLWSGKDLAGFSMELLSKDFFVLQNVFDKNFCKNNKITLDIKMKYIRGMIAAMKSAHALGIRIGDFNQYNIMVDVKGNVKLLDVDSYETPSHPHSGILLDEIRDYYYQGKVSQNSDYFALSVLIFNMACYVHPFKGIHARFKKIADRMLNKIPIFKKDPDLKLPNFYEPLKQPELLTQFERMYMGSVERFIIDIDAQQTASLIATSPLAKPTLKKFEQDALYVQEILSDDIENIFTIGGRLLVRTSKSYMVYDCSNKGYLTLLSTIGRDVWDHLFLGPNCMIGIKNNRMFLEASRKVGFKEVTSITVTDNTKFFQLESVLFLLKDDQLVKLNMNKVFGNLIDYKVDSVLSQSFNYFGGFFFRSGKNQLFFNASSNGMPDVLPMPVNITALYQVGRFGMVKYMEKKGKTTLVVNKYFRVDNRKVLLSARDADEIYQFAYQNDGKGEGFIFQPYNGYIRIIRTNDFEENSRLKLDICTTQSTIRHTHSGMLLWEDDKLWLVNTR